jgi:hypothetical protein
VVRGILLQFACASERHGLVWATEKRVSAVAGLGIICALNGVFSSFLYFRCILYSKASEQIKQALLGID